MGIDIGTSSTKASIINEEGKLAAEASATYPISTPAAGWAEQDPETWWTATKEAIKKAMQSSKIKPEQILGIGLSGQMHGTILLDKDLSHLRPAIIWADKRSQNQCEEIYEKIGKERVLKIVCNPVMPGFMAPSLLWVKEKEPLIFGKVSKVLLPKDYIRFKLTGYVATDVSDASATLLFDVKRRKWSEEIISTLGFKPDSFPEIYESTDVTGEVSKEASRQIHLPSETKVIAGGGDSPVGAVGCGMITPGTLSSNIGSAGQIFTVLDEMKVDPKFRVHTFCHAVSGKWYLQGAMLSAGLSLKWFVETLGIADALGLGTADPYELISQEAGLVEAGSEGLIFMPYLMGERSPHMDPSARGVFFGLTSSHSRAHLARAIMEGVVYALRDSVEIFKELGVKIDGTLSRGGGAKSTVWRQIQADIFNSKVMTVETKEETAFGAALLAGVGTGIYKDLHEAVEKTVKVRCAENPEQERVKIYEYYYQKVYRELYPLLKPYFKLLQESESTTG